MIHLCVVWRKNKWVITSSDTVTFDEKLRSAHKEYCKKLNYWKDSEIIEYLNEGIKEVGR